MRHNKENTPNLEVVLKAAAVGLRPRHLRSHKSFVPLLHEDVSLVEVKVHLFVCNFELDGII